MRTRTPTNATIFGWVPSTVMFSVLFSQLGVIDLCVIRASALKPVRLKISHFVETAFNAATTNVLKIGNATSDVAYSADLVAGADVLEFIIRADTTIRVTHTESGTASTAGRSDIVLDMTPLG